MIKIDQCTIYEKTLEIEQKINPLWTMDNQFLDTQQKYLVITINLMGEFNRDWIVGKVYELQLNIHNIKDNELLTKIKHSCFLVEYCFQNYNSRLVFNSVNDL